MAKSDEDIILDGLQKAIGALPELLPLSGTKALFTAKQSHLARRAVEDGWLTTRAKRVKSGKTAKVVELALVTESGARKVAGRGSASDLRGTLELIRKGVESLSAPVERADPTTFRAAVDAAAEKCVGAINTAFAELRNEVLHAIGSSGTPSIDPSPILTALTTTLNRIEPSVVRVPVVLDEPAEARPATPEPRALESIADEIVTFVNDAVAAHTVGCDFGELFEHLRSNRPSLTIGEFHDALRSLDGGGRLRLRDWPRMLDEIPRPELALFVSHTVMYHAQPAQ